MNDPVLKDPRMLYHPGEFKKQDQSTPPLQEKMTPAPDCGENSYVGNQKLTNRRVLITGGDSGIGRAVAIAFAREGADVAIQFVPGEEEDASDVKRYIEKAGRKALLLAYDLKDEESPRMMVQEVLDHFGGIDTLVLNAAQQIAHKEISELSIQQVKDTFQVNIISMFALVKEAAPYLPIGSAIITTTSVQATSPSEHLMDYAATKAAISNFTMSLASQFSKKGIRVNSVAPGPIWTPLQLDGGQLPEALPGFGQDSLLGRAGQPVELAPVYVFLASNEASYVTSQIYGVTGGKPIN